MTYTPTTGANVHTVNAAYAGASPHAASSDPDGFDLTVNLRSTATTVTCSPASVALNQASTCNVQVDDTAAGTKSNPTGTVNFSRAGAGTGTFSSATCTLTPIAADPDSSHCTTSVTYTPTTGANVHTVNAAYAGASPHAASSDPDGFDLTVNLRSTATTVTCSPASVALNQASTCDVQVDDTAAGTKSNPTGTVNFSRAGAGTGTFSSATCTLTPIAADPDSSHCTTSVTYTPTTGANVHTVNAAYAGASPHAASSDPDGFAITVERAHHLDDRRLRRHRWPSTRADLCASP